MDPSGLRDLKMATVARDQGYPEWACFIAQQAAEKGLKAVLHARGVIAWGHAITDLLRAYQEYQPVPLDLMKQARSLDRYYIPARYPNGFAEGTPW